MGHRLPLELLIQIARYLDADNVSLQQYALVCRDWQAAFEGFIYRSMTVHSDKLPEFDRVISKYQRRFHISTLTCKIDVPYDLPDYSARLLEDARPGEMFAEENPIRAANDKAFQTGIVKLMDYLKSWGGSSRLHLILELSGRDQALEPGTERDEEVQEFASLRNGDLTPRPYRARFPSSGNDLELPILPVVYQLSNSLNAFHRIWPAAVLRIASCCPNLHSLFLNIRECVRPDHVDYMQKRRKALAEGLSSLPASLRVFRVESGYDNVWHGSQPGLDLLAGAKDIFSHNLRDLSMRLQELDITPTPVALDIFFPLHADETALDQHNVNWPALETLNISGRNFLPTGEWLLDPTEEEEEENEAPDWDDQSEYNFESIRIVEESPYDRSQLRTDLAHQCFTSLGLAAQHMPRLRSAAFYLTVRPELALLLRTDAGSGTRTLTWQGYYEATGGYMPDNAVARAWGFEFDDLVDIGRSFPTYRVELKQWPPGLS
ncbi:hypothetical protein BDV18DRAFT_155198 [Aspergillus unguis]